MAKHKFRLEPSYVDGLFVPSVPVPIAKPLNDYTVWDMVPTALSVARNPLETFNAAQYKIPVSQYPLFGQFFTVINHPDMIRHCFVENRHKYGFQTIRQTILRSIIGDGLITAEGETWRHARRAMSPMFTPRAIKGFGRIMREATEREMPELLDTETVIPIAPAMATLTYLVLSDTLFSGDIDEEKQQVVDNVATALLYMGRPDPLDLMQAPQWMPRLTRLRGLKAAASLRGMIGRVIAHRKALTDANTPSQSDDFLGRLLNVGDEETQAFTDVQIEDHMLAFIGAGHETTARALSWLFYLLANDTNARERLEAEVDALDIDNISPEKWGDALPFSTACFEETMRLFPPAPMIVREAIEDDQFQTTHIPKSSVLMLNTWLLHRHETLWERPEAFNPERFLGENRKTIGRFQYLPFGVGERVCIGQRFAMQEALILIVLIARRYRFDYAGSDVPWPKMRITVQPENGMPMHVTRRR